CVRMSLANVRQGTYRDVETFLRLEPGDRQHDPRSRRKIVRWIASPGRGRLVQAVVDHLELRLGQADPLDLKSCERLRDRDDARRAPCQCALDEAKRAGAERVVV